MPLPNSGKMNRLIAQLNRRTVQLGLYKNVVTPTDGSLTAYSLTEMPTTGGRGYASMQLARTINLSALAASQWYIAPNSSGKGQAQYSNAPLQWTMTSVEVSDGNTPQGGFGYCWFLPFKSGAIEIRAGDIIKGAAGAIAVVTDVLLLSGSWAAGTANGYLYLETKTGTFVDSEVITISGAIATAAIHSAAAGASYVLGNIVHVASPDTTNGRPATLVVTAVDGGGAVTAFIVVDPGQGFVVDSTGLATTGGSGTGFKIDVSTLATTTYAHSNSGTENGGDAHKDLMFLSAIATPVQITVVGQPITITPILTEDTDPTVG